MGNKNVFEGDVKIGKNAQIAGGDIYNVDIHNNEDGSRARKPEYKAEPVWRSPFTLAVLSWISVITGILSLLPVGGMIKNIINMIQTMDIPDRHDAEVHFILFVIFGTLFMFFMSLRRIAKRETRHPLRVNYAISGYGKRITIEKIHIEKCPKCGGEMKYYNKPIWEYNETSKKDEVVKRIPGFECKRNSKHWYEVDPAEDKIS